MGNTAPILAGANTKDALINSETATDSLSNIGVVLNNQRSRIATDNIITIINENNDINNTERSIVNGSHSRTSTTTDTSTNENVNSESNHCKMLISSSNKTSSTTMPITTNQSSNKRMDQKAFYNKNNHTFHSSKNSITKNINNNCHRHHQIDQNIDHFLKQLIQYNYNNNNNNIRSSSKVERRNALEKLLELASYSDDNKRMIADYGGIVILIDIIKQTSTLHQHHHHYQQYNDNDDSSKNDTTTTSSTSSANMYMNNNDYLRPGVIELLGSLATIVDNRQMMQRSDDLWSSLSLLLRDGSSISNSSGSSSSSSSSSSSGSSSSNGSKSSLHEMISICKLINMLSICTSTYDSNYYNDNTDNCYHHDHHHHQQQQQQDRDKNDNIRLYIESTIPLIIHLLNNYKILLITTKDIIVIIDMLHNLLLSYHQVSIIITQCKGMKIILQFINIRNYSDNGGGGDDDDDTDYKNSYHYDHKYYNINNHDDKVHHYKNNDAAHNTTTNKEILLSAVLSLINQIMRIIIFDYPHLCLYFNIYFDDKYLYNLRAILQRHNGSSDVVIHDGSDDDEDGDHTSKIEISTKNNNNEYDNNNNDMNVKYYNIFQSIHNHVTTINTNNASNSTVRTTTSTRTSIVMMINKQAIICISLLCYNHKLRDIILKLDYLKLISNLLQRYCHLYYREQLINNHSEHHTSTATTTTYPTNTNTTTTSLTITMMSCIIEALGNMVNNQDSFQIITEYNVIHILFDILYHHHQHQEMERDNKNHVINNHANKHHYHHHSFRLLAVKILQKWLHYDDSLIIITIGGGINALISFSESLVTGYDNNNDNDNNNHDDDSNDVKYVLVDMIKQVMGKKQKQLNREMNNLVSTSKESSSSPSSSSKESSSASVSVSSSSYVPLSSASRLVNHHHPSSSMSSSSPYQHTQLMIIKQDKMISEEFDDDNIDWLQDFSFVRTRALLLS